MEPNYIANYSEGNKINELISEISWSNMQVARGECFMSDIEREYQYILNGPIYKSIPFNKLVLDIMNKINHDFGYNLNVCFLNYYADHTKALGWHADDSYVIDQSQPIAVVSFGKTREIWWKPMEFKGVIPIEWKQALADGSLFIMPAGMQDIYKHKIPKGDRNMGPRVSLTYRCWK